MYKKKLTAPCHFENLAPHTKTKYHKMRTKTLLLTAALAVAGLTTSIAQTVYSVNAVGFVNISVPAGAFALLANPLDQPTNDLASVLADAPVGTSLYDWTGTAFNQYTKRPSLLWTGGPDTIRLSPGKGFFVKNNGTAAFTITFIGEVPQGPKTVAIQTGFNLIASPHPLAGTVQTQLGLPAVANDQVYFWTGTAYVSSTLRASGAWTGGIVGEPAVTVGQGFWLSRATANGAASWTRTFSVNQ